MADDIKLVRVDHDIIVVSLVDPRGFRVWQVGAGGRPWLGGLGEGTTNLGAVGMVQPYRVVGFKIACFEGWASVFLFSGVIVVGPCGRVRVCIITATVFYTFDCDDINASNFEYIP